MARGQFQGRHRFARAVLAAEAGEIGVVQRLDAQGQAVNAGLAEGCEFWLPPRWWGWLPG